jgi:hypothetical protein
MRFSVGTKVYYLEIGRDGRRTRHRPDGQQVGEVIGERDNRGARVRWEGEDKHEGSVLWDWIDDKPPRG